MAKDNKIWIIIGIVILILLLRSCKTETQQTDTPMGITFETRSGSLTQAVVGGQLVPAAEGKFNVNIGNTKPIVINDVEFVSKADTWGAGTPFDTATFAPSTISSLGAASTGATSSTSWFELEWYALNHPGVTRFTFNYKYDYKDAEGSDIFDQVISGYKDVLILGETCTDGTKFDACNSQGERCQLVGNVLDTLPDQACCAQVGGTWGAGICNFDCGPVTSGQCDTTPVSNVVTRETYCDGTTLVEKCSQCHCFDYYGNQEVSCDAQDKCVFATYEQQVTVNIVDEGTGNFCDSCTGWTVGTLCGEGICDEDKLLQTRTCDPTGCSPNDGLGLQMCVTDASCTPCNCPTTWTDGLCGAAGGCPVGERRQTRACSPAGCGTETQCVTDASCNVEETLIQVTGSSVGTNPLSSPSDRYGEIVTTDSGSNYQITSVQLTLKKSNSPGQCNVEIRGTTAGLPNGVIHSTGNFNGNELITTFSTVTVSMTTTTNLLPSTQYAVIFYCPSIPGGSSVSTQIVLDNTAGHGPRVWSENSGTTYNTAIYDVPMVIKGIRQ